MNSNQEASASKYFDADRPIEYRRQDRLGRRSFAEAIARQLRAVPAEHGSPSLLWASGDQVRHRFSIWSRRHFRIMWTP